MCKSRKVAQHTLRSSVCCAACTDPRVCGALVARTATITANSYYYQWWGKIGLWKKTKNGLPEAVLVDFHTDFRCG
jgi:hypothetical protein